MKHLSLKQQRGVSLIEILVTTLILGVGLLGVASLQTSSISSNQEGYFYSQATSIAEDLSSRVRASKMTEMIAGTTTLHADFIANYAQENVYTCTTPPDNFCSAKLGNGPSEQCRDGNDDLTDIAAFDRWDICTIAKRTLPEGKVHVLSSGRRLSIVVEWRPINARVDQGQKQKANTFCPNTVREGSNCIITEILP